MNDDRSKKTFGLMVGVNILTETPKGLTIWVSPV